VEFAKKNEKRIQKLGKTEGFISDGLIFQKDHEKNGKKKISDTFTDVLGTAR